ncbi:hypothetical protein C7457_0424 [Thermovibrio guaymasensis]|uniref:Uncharacterized protein n=1 Tax=Thermovibrio guaymasensis TaxID=240167 RepID=A0A420W897_9BACT|nr:hypothetical protein [Thermovibrio guaymasensis]RKQ63550.1 hypothetical protein C7457_0424 [Thermovibrio guaymasensis]
MTGIIGLKEEFLKGKRELLDKARQLKKEGKSWKEIEEFIREEFKEEISLLKPNLFTYFLIFGGALILPLLYLWKVYFEPGTTAHFISRLLFILSAMFALKGFVGHYVVIFINRDRFEAELRALKASIEGGDNGKQPN